MFITRIKNGDEEVYMEIIDEFSGYLAKVVRSVGNFNVHDVEDIIAESMMALWRGAKKLREDTNLKAFLATIARNKAIDILRKRRAEFVELDVNLSDASDVEGDYLRREVSEAVSGQIAGVSEPDKSILTMKYYDGLKSKEIAERLNMSQNKVDVRLSRQRKKKKKTLLKMEVFA
jgi:RNA polymerase sigma-70 factor (ECF subfamily)